MEVINKFFYRFEQISKYASSTNYIFTHHCLFGKDKKMANQATGQVTGILANEGTCHFVLTDPNKPKDGWFVVPLTNPNYNSIYSLVMVAAVNRYDLNVVTRKDIVNTELAEVAHVYVGW